ncbi:MAG: hypothetical protein O2818_05600 [Bacteroidetes bacterium]|nr:hypothetical protein [Bacteroidota bacterium]MDA1336347.1 hypothetical protein [Bacteroidota bacterium]
MKIRIKGRRFRLTLAVLFLANGLSGWSQSVNFGFIQKDLAIHEALMAPHRNPDLIPPGFEVDVDLELRDEEWWLISDVRLPYGGYVISSTCDIDYLGKFQVNWNTDSKVDNIGWEELPPSAAGYEPFEAEMVPMIVQNTQVSTRLIIDEKTAAAQGKIFMVLEPQCVPYSLSFQLVKTAAGWGIIQGRLVSALKSALSD